MARSSTTSQPTAIRPFTVSRTPRSSSARSSTTVLAHDRHSPKTRDSPGVQPQRVATSAPRSVAAVIWTMAPGTAMRRTDSRSPIDRCRPTPNMSSITPISASWLASAMSATNPGVCGPTRIPATR